MSQSQKDRDYRDKLIADKITEALLQKVFATKFFMKLIKEDAKRKDEYYGAEKKNRRCKRKSQHKKAKRTRKKCIHHCWKSQTKCPVLSAWPMVHTE